MFFCVCRIWCKEQKGKQVVTNINDLAVFKSKYVWRLCVSMAVESSNMCQGYLSKHILLREHFMRGQVKQTRTMEGKGARHISTVLIWQYTVT